MNDQQAIDLQETPEFALTYPYLPAVGVGPTLQDIYDQNEQILAHVQGIEQAFRQVAENMESQINDLLNNSPLGGMLAKFMGRAREG